MKTTLKKILKGERITLKRSDPSIALATKIFEVVDRNRKHLTPWLPWVEWIKSIEDTLQSHFDFKKKAKLEKEYSYRIFLWNIYIGNIGYFSISKENKSCEIWYWIDKEYTKKGYITEAVKVLEAELFEKWFNRIEICCDERNVASVWVAKKCGYTLEWKLREHIYSKYHDDMSNTFIFSKLKSEYLATQD